MAMDDPNDASAMTSVRGDAATAGGSAKKRLLPMELRRRRRAAKLQITAERNVATISAKELIEDAENAEITAPDEAPATTTKAEERTPSPAPIKHNLASQDAADSATQMPVESITPQQAQYHRPPPRATTTKQLKSLFSFSLLDRKRKKQQQRDALVDVPLSVQTERVPLDLAPKSKAVITVSGAFHFHRPRAASLAAAMADHATTQPDVRWLRALQYYVHPASPLPPSLSLASDKQLEDGAFYVQRFQLWQASFRHAYLGFRRLQHGGGTLYVRYPEFVACFFIDSGRSEGESRASSSLVSLCNAYVDEREQEGVAGKHQQHRRRLCATLSQSNARLRKDLRMRGVDFAVPFNTRAMQRPISNLPAEEDAWAATNPIDHSTEQNVHGPDSLLHFEDHQAVHGLFEFLLNRKPHSNQDVPEIIAQHPFANAAIRSVDFRYMGKAGSAAHGAQGDPPSHRSEIEVSGFCTTPTLVKLVQCLEDAARQEESFDASSWAVKVAMETAPMGERLNAVLLDHDRMRPEVRVAQSTRERAQWKQQLDFAKRRLLAIRKRGDKHEVEVEMTTRS